MANFSSPRIRLLFAMLAVIQQTREFILEDDQHHNYEHYIAVPAQFDYSVGSEFVHIYITADRDTRVDITLHDTYLYRAARLTRKNDWSWHEGFFLSGDLQKSAYSKGFDIYADNPVTILLTRNSSDNEIPLTYTVFALPKQQNTEYIVGCYTSLEVQKSQFLVATGHNATRISAYGPGSDTPTLADLLVDPYTVYEYNMEAPRNIIGFRLKSTGPAAIYGSCRQTVAAQYIGRLGVDFYQIPSLDLLGKQYVVGPLAKHELLQQYAVLIIPSAADTSISITHTPEQPALDVRQKDHCRCRYKTSSVCTVTCDGPLNSDWYIKVGYVLADQAVVVDCSAPCLVFVQEGNVKGVHDSLVLIGSLVLTAPVRVLPTGVHFFVPFAKGERYVQKVRVSIAVPEAAAGGLLVDGVRIGRLQAVLKYDVTSVSNWTLVSLDLQPGNHRVIHETAHSVPISVHVHGVMLPISCYAGETSTFGYPATVSGIVKSAKQKATNIALSAININNSQSSLNTARHYQHRLAVVGIILLVAVFLAVLGVVVIGIRNSALLRVIIYGQEMLFKKKHEDASNEKQNVGLDDKVEIDEKEVGEEQDGDMYLVPTTQRLRYEKLKPKMAETDLDKTDVTYDTIT